MEVERFFIGMEEKGVYEKEEVEKMGLQPRQSPFLQERTGCYCQGKGELLSCGIQSALSLIFHGPGIRASPDAAL